MMIKTKQAGQPAIVNLSFFNCYTFGNGVESNHVLDGLTKPFIQLGEKVTSVSEEQYQEAIDLQILHIVVYLIKKLT